MNKTLCDRCSHLIKKHIRITANFYIIQSTGQSGKTIDSFNNISFVLKIKLNYRKWRKNWTHRKTGEVFFFFELQKVDYLCKYYWSTTIDPIDTGVCALRRSRVSKTRIFLWILHAPSKVCDRFRRYIFILLYKFFLELEFYISINLRTRSFQSTLFDAALKRYYFLLEKKNFQCYLWCILETLVYSNSWKFCTAHRRDYSAAQNWAESGHSHDEIKWMIKTSRASMAIKSITIKCAIIRSSCLPYAAQNLKYRSIMNAVNKFVCVTLVNNFAFFICRRFGWVHLGASNLDGKL